MSIEEQELIPASVPAVIPQRSAVRLTPVMNIEQARTGLREFQEFVSGYMEEGIDGDFGVIPGTKKKTLLKPGADKLCELYGLYDEYEVISSVEDWDRGLFDYTLRCVLKSRRDDSLVGTGLGSCSSFESKYRWRDQKRKCPKCQAELIIKGKDEYGGGWLCWKKQGGCGATFKDGDKAIEGQVIGRIENPDIVDTKNTVLKMAKKRAKIDAVIGATRSSGIFTQDYMGEEEPRKVAEPETTTEAKTYSRKTETNDIAGPGSTSAVKSGKTTAKPRELTAESIPETAGNPDGMCTKEMQDWLRMEFKSLLPPKYHAHADEFRRDFLKSQGYVNEKGVGTSTKIPLLLFKAVAKDCLNHAKTLEAL